jgi:hypothetical protein
MRLTRRNPSSDVTNSLAFRRWFGKSKVVDEDGAPLVVYHGTAADFDQFSPERIGSNFSISRGGFFFVSSEEAAWNYAEDAADEQEEIELEPRVFSVYLALENPLILKASHDRWPDMYFDDNADAILRRAHRGNHDGVIVHGIDPYSDNEPRSIYIAFEPTQIKSATANAGTFDPEDPSILRNPRRSHRRNPLGVQLEAGHPRLRPAQAFIDEWHARDMDRVFEEMGARVDVSVGSSNDPDVVNLDSLEATTYRKGAGSRALRALLDLTDKHNLGVRLTAEPFSFAYPAPADLISRDALIRFYTRFGFRHDDAAESEEWDEPEEGYYPMFRAPPSWWTR